MGTGLGSGFKTRNTSLPYGILSDDETALGLKPSTYLDGPFKPIPTPHEEEKDQTYTHPHEEEKDQTYTPPLTRRKWTLQTWRPLRVAFKSF